LSWADPDIPVLKEAKAEYAKLQCTETLPLAAVNVLDRSLHGRFSGDLTWPLLGDHLGPDNVYSPHTLISPEEIRKMPDEEWINTLEDGRKVKFIYQELPEDGALITAQLAGNEVVYSVILTKAGNPLSREDVESHFEGELSKK
jgi:hypothetical protein